MLKREGQPVCRRRVSTLMKRMGINALYRKPNTSKRHPAHPVYPYLLRNMSITRSNHVWAADIAYTQQFDAPDKLLQQEECRKYRYRRQEYPKQDNLGGEHRQRPRAKPKQQKQAGLNGPLGCDLAGKTCSCRCGPFTWECNYENQQSEDGVTVVDHLVIEISNRKQSSR